MLGFPAQSATQGINVRILTPALQTAQTTGYPTGGYQPAVRCILTSKDGGTTYDYSFDPTASNNQLMHIYQIEERENDGGGILLNNYARSLPTDLTGYYVDVGWGHNTASGIKWAEADGAVSPRLWVMQHIDISGGLKGQMPISYTVLNCEGVWAAVLNKQPIRLGTTPYFRYDELDTIPELTNLTIYGVLEYLIETALSAQTGFTFTLDALGTQDDGHINTDIPYPGGGVPLREINSDSPGTFQTYGEVIISLLELTKCILVPRAGLAFRIIYPQTTDTVNETYFSGSVLTPPSYEVENRRLNMTPNHIEVFGTEPATGVGDWFDPDHYTTAPTRPLTPASIQAAYTGEFMPVTLSISEDGLDTEVEADARASALGRQLKDRILGARVVIPMDARVELYDRVKVSDQRGH